MALGLNQRKITAVSASLPWTPEILWCGLDAKDIKATVVVWMLTTTCDKMMIFIFVHLDVTMLHNKWKYKIDYIYTP